MSKSLPPDRREGADTGGKSNRSELMRYAGLSGQVLASVGISLFLGIKADKWLHISFPLFACGLPLLVIVGLMIQLVKEGSRKKDGK
jgi:hypothetical protein